jgi:hypothetical protein
MPVIKDKNTNIKGEISAHYLTASLWSEKRRKTPIGVHHGKRSNAQQPRSQKAQAGEEAPTGYFAIGRAAHSHSTDCIGHAEEALKERPVIMRRACCIFHFASSWSARICPRGPFFPMRHRVFRVLIFQANPSHHDCSGHSGRTTGTSSVQIPAMH